MSEVANVTSLVDRIQASRSAQVFITPTALEVAVGYIRQQKEIASIAEELELEASWRCEEEQMLAALAGHGLKKTIKTP